MQTKAVWLGDRSATECAPVRLRPLPAPRWGGGAPADASGARAQTRRSCWEGAPEPTRTKEWMPLNHTTLPSYSRGVRSYNPQAGQPASRQQSRPRSADAEIPLRTRSAERHTARHLVPPRSGTWDWHCKQPIPWQRVRPWRLPQTKPSCVGADHSHSVLGLEETSWLLSWSSSELAAGSGGGGWVGANGCGAVLLAAAWASCWLTGVGLREKNGLRLRPRALSGGAGQMAPEACTPNVCRRASALTDVRLWEGRGGGGGAAGVAAGLLLNSIIWGAPAVRQGCWWLAGRQGTHPCYPQGTVRVWAKRLFSVWNHCLRVSRETPRKGFLNWG